MKKIYLGRERYKIIIDSFGIRVSFRWQEIIAKVIILTVITGTERVNFIHSP